MKAEKMFSRFALEEETLEKIVEVTTLLKVQKLIKQQIEEGREAIEIKLAAYLVKRLPEKIQSMFRVFMLASFYTALKRGIQWSSDGIDFYQSCSVTLPLTEMRGLGIKPDEFIKKVNAAWGNTAEGEPTENSLARLHQSWENESQLEGLETIQIYFTLTVPTEQLVNQ